MQPTFESRPEFAPEQPGAGESFDIPIVKAAGVKRGGFPWILGVVAFLLGFGITLRFSALPSRQLAAQIEQALGEVVSLPISVSQAWLDPASSAIVLAGVKLGSNPSEPDAEIPRARIELQVGGGGFHVTRVFLEAPTLRYSIFAKPLFKTTGVDAPGQMPTIAVKDGRFEVVAPSVGLLLFSELTALARDAGGGEVQISGTVRTPLHGLLRVGGGGNHRTGQFDVRAATEYPVDLSSLTGAELDPRLLAWRGALEPSGRLSLAIHLTRDGPDSPMRVEAQLEGTGLSCTGPALKVGDGKLELHRIGPTNFSLAARIEPDGTARLSAQGRILGSASVEVLAEAKVSLERGEYSDFRAGARIRQWILGGNVESLLDGLDPSKGVGDVFRGLHPEGPVDVTVSVSKAAEDAPLELASDVDLTHDLALTFLGFKNRDGSIDANFPYRITDPSGRISIRPGRVLLAGVRARIGSSTVQAHGEITGGGLVGIQVGVRVDDLALDRNVEDAIHGWPTDPELRARLERSQDWQPVGLEDGAAAVKLFDLEGKVRVDVRAKRPQGVSTADVTVRLSSDGTVRGRFRTIPVPVEGLTGAVVFRGGAATFAFDGNAAGGRLRFEGAIDPPPESAGAPAGESGLRLRVRGTDVDVNESFGEYFRGAVPDLADLLVEMEPKVKVDFEYRGERRRGSPSGALAATVSIGVDGGVVRQVPKLGIELEDFRGSVLVTTHPAQTPSASFDTHLTSIRAKYFGAPVIAHGLVAERSAVSRTLDIEGIGLDLPFTGKLVQQVVSRHSERAAEALGRFTFGGKVEARFRRVETEASTANRVEFELRNAAMSGPGLPGDFEGFSGHLTVGDDDSVRADTLTGRMNGVAMRIDNLEIVSGSSADPISIRGTATTEEPVDIAVALTTAFPGARRWVDALEFGLMAVANPASFDFSVNAAGDVRFDAVGHLVVRDGHALHGGTISAMRGEVDLESLRFDANGFSVSAWIEDGRFLAHGVPISNFVGRLEFDQDSLSVTSATLEAAGGRIGPRLPGKDLFHIAYHGDASQAPRWSFSGLLDGADLGKLFESVSNKRDVRGRVRAGVDLQGVGLDILSLDGSGILRIEQANLFEVPGFQAVYTGLQLEAAPMFHELVGDFTLRKGRVDFRSLSVKSDPLDLKGDGWVSLDGRLDMTFLPRLKGGLSSFLNPGGLFNTIQDRFVDVSVFGTLDNTRYTVNIPFSTKGKLKKQVIAPEPPVDLGERF